MTPPFAAAGQSVSIPREVLRGSARVTREGTPLVRGNVSESADESVIEVPLPLADIERQERVQVLHVDDDPEIGEVTAMFLERINDDFDVVTETTVVAALERLKRREVDCVISDYQMPATDGLEFLEIVREQYPDLPFILFTGQGSEEIASEAIAAGVTDYMQKGAGSDIYEVLANRVENAVEQYRTQQQFWTALSWYQRLVEQELAGVFIVQNTDFVYVNQKLAGLFGYDQHDLIGESPLSIVGEEDRDVVLEALIEQEEGEVDTFEYAFTGEAADGSTVQVEVNGGAITYDGGPAWIGILRECSEESLAE
jgi:PAS domain S-box-containing protein